MKATLILACTLLLAASAPTLAADAPPCQIHTILFLPANVAQPAAYQKRIDEIVNYAESFLVRGIEHWGHKNVVRPFRRADDGHVEVTVIRGKQPGSKYKPVPVRMEVMDALRQRNVLNNARQVWWIFVYPGDPPARFDSFLLN